MTKAKLFSNKLCKSAYQKYLAKKKTTEQKGASKWSQYITLLGKKTASGQRLLQPDSNLRLINNTFKTAPVITSGAPPSSIQITVTALRCCIERI